MGLVLQLVETRADGGTRSVELMELGRPGNLHDIADLGLTLPEAKQLLRCVQQAVVAVQARDHATLRVHRHDGALDEQLDPLLLVHAAPAAAGTRPPSRSTTVR